MKDEKPGPNFVYREDASAPVKRGSAEVTNEIRRYIWPQNENPNIALWDIPGGGTRRHQTATYFEEKVLYAFDCLLLLTNGRFTELDNDIIKQACDCQTPIVLVMTKVDQEIDNEREEYPEKPLQEVIDDVLQDLKQNVNQKLCEIHSTQFDVPIYAVAAKQFRKEISNQITNDECSSLEMWPLISYCLSRAQDRRVSAIL